MFGITMPIVKHSFMIQHPLEIPRAIHEAFHIARTGRPGPVVVDIPTDLSRADIDYEPVTDVRLPGYQPTTEGNPKQIRQAAKALAAARRPVIYAGGGVINANASEELTQLVLSDRLPDHLHAHGPGRVPGAAPAVARHARHARHADGELRDGRGRPDRGHRRALRRPDHRQAVRVRAAGEVHPHRHRPGRDLQERPGAHPDRGRREEHRRPARGRVPRARGRPGAAGGVVGADRAVAGAVSAALRGLRGHRDQAAVPGPGALRGHDQGRDAILSTDIGQHQMWAAQYFHFTKPRRWIQSGGLGTMGFGLPAAMGAAVARPDLQSVVCCPGTGRSR